jgi:lipid II:glycine glycyltransferase (peptidoglycan interpeptide bridge formation enzyme)
MLGNQRWIKDDRLEILFDRFTLSTDLGKYNDNKNYYPKPTRNVIDRGIHLGLEAKELEVDQGFPLFMELYQKTMLRLDADPDYFFNNYYFDRLRSLVKEHGFLMGALYKSQIVAAGIFLCGFNWVHYHLSASDFDNRVPGATNIILDQAFEKAKLMEFSLVHLGGGRTSDSEDGLLRFKKSMSTDMHRFYIGKRIYNSKVYDDLVATWKQEYPELVIPYQARLLCYHYQL